MWDVERITTLLQKNDRMVQRSIQQLYNKCQTLEERLSKETLVSNGLGFNGVDAPLLSSFAQQLNEGHALTPKQMIWARKKIMKYAKQITRIANMEV